MAREMYLVGVSEEELQPPKKPEAPKTPKGKWENYWYHYKWPTLAAIAAVIALTVIIVQIVTKPKYDYTFVLATNRSLINVDVETLTDELAKYGRDINGDGEVKVQVDYINMDVTTGMATTSNTKLMAHLSAGDVMFFVFQKDSYDTFIKNLRNSGTDTFFSPIELDAEGISSDEGYWNWKGSAIQQDKSMARLPEDLYFGVRQAIGTAGKDSSVKMHDDGMELLKALITGTPLTPAEENSEVS